MTDEYPITISIVRSEQEPRTVGVELDNSNVDAPICLRDLHPQAQHWILEHPVLNGEDPDAWVLVTDDYRVPNAVNVVAALEAVDIRPTRVEWIDFENQSEEERERSVGLIADAMLKPPTREHGGGHVG